MALKKILATSSPQRIENELHILESLRFVCRGVERSKPDQRHTGGAETSRKSSRLSGKTTRSLSYFPFIAQTTFE